MAASEAGIEEEGQLLPFTIGPILVITCLTALVALAAHLGRAVFHDGVRPIMPELIEGRMERRELASIASGLSMGFITSVGITFAISFQMLNPWLLFLPADIIGIMARRWWIALLGGAIWGLAAIAGLSGLLAVLADLPVDMIGALSAFGSPVLGAIAAYPLLAILQQFKWRSALISTAVVFIVIVTCTQLTDLGQLSLLAITTLTSFLLLIGFVVRQELKSRRQRRLNGERSPETEVEVDEETEAEQLKQWRTIKRSLPLFMAIGACAALASHLGIFAGTDVSLPFLQEVWGQDGQGGDSGFLAAAAVDTVRLLSFVPLLAVTALATGVHGVAGLMLMFPIGYLSPNPLVAAVLGAAVMALEVLALRRIVGWLTRYPHLREASDYMRSAMNAMLEIGFLIGGALAVLRMEGGSPGIGLVCFLLLYAANESLGRPVMRVAIGPVLAIATGLILNLVHYIS
ncbi:YhfT family protein [Paenibacillus sp. strain BS8-2]